MHVSYERSVHGNCQAGHINFDKVPSVRSQKFMTDFIGLNIIDVISCTLTVFLVCTFYHELI